MQVSAGNPVMLGSGVGVTTRGPGTRERERRMQSTRYEIQEIEATTKAITMLMVFVILYYVFK